MRKSFKAVLSLMLCFILVSSTALVSFAVGDVTGLKATDVTATSAKLTWNAVSGADGYQYRSYTGGTYSSTVTISGRTNTTYTAKLAAGKTYYLYVRSYDKGVFKTTYGNWVKVTVKAVPAAVTDFKATNYAGGTSVKLSWSKVTGVTGYVVQQYKNNKWTNIKTTTGLYYKVTGLTPGTTYKFRITAYVKSGGKNIYSSYVAINATPTYLAPTSLKVTKTTATAAALSWDAVSGAKKYQIYNYDTKTYSYSSTTAVTLTGLEAGKVYRVRVRGYAAVGGKNVYGAFTSYLSFTTITDKVTGLQTSELTDTSVNVSFDKKANALGYQVYLYDYATKTDTRLVAKLTDNTYAIEGLKPASTYRIGVRTYIYNSASCYYSGFSYTYIDTPPVIETGAQTNETQIELQWSEVRKATRYTIERFAPNKAEWTLISEVPVETPYTGTVTSSNKVSFIDETAGKNKGYIYRVKAYNGETLINEAQTEASTTGITVENKGNSVTVNWNAPADATLYTVYKMPVITEGTVNYYAHDFEISDPDTESFTFNLAPDEYHSYMIVATGSSAGTVACFTVKADKLVIDSSDASKTAQLLMLVNAINKSKLYQGDVKVTVDSYAKMVLDAIYFSEEMLDNMDGGAFIKAITDNGEISGDKIVEFFNILKKLGLATDEDIPETVTIEDPAPVTYNFSEGYGKNEKDYTIALKTLIEPSGTPNKLAYLYNEHDVKTWKDACSSVNTIYYPATGKYKVVVTLKQERFGTTTNQDDAKYHHGFLSVYDALGFSGDDVNNELTTLGATTITAYIDAEGRLYNYTVTAPFSTKFAATGGSNASLGMKMSGTTTLQYKLYF